MGFLRQEVELGEDVFDVLPVLHLQCIGLVNHRYLNRREEIGVMAPFIFSAVTIVLDSITQAQGRGDYDVGTVEGRKEFDRFARELQANAKHVVVVTAKKFTKISRLVIPCLVFLSTKALLKAGFVFLLLWLADRYKAIH